MGKLIRHKLPAFSLPETIVALVIILSIFGMATMILAGTAKSQVSVRELTTRNLLQRYADKTLQQRDFSNNTETVEEYMLRREVGAYPEYDSLVRIHYYIYDRNHQLLADWQLLERLNE
jgi:hypothetical protein